MSDRRKLDLRAAAMPRIAVGAPTEESSRPACADPLRAAADRLLLLLVDQARSQLPWRLGPSAYWRLWGLRLVVGTAIAAIVSAWFHRSMAWGLSGVPLLVLALKWPAIARHQQARRRAAELRNELRTTSSLTTLDPELGDYVRLAPEDPAGRYLLALARAESHRPVEALMQLAALRDRYPSVGEVVLLAAIACAQLLRPGQAGQLLSALEIGPGHPWWNEVLEFAHACGVSVPGVESA